MSAGAAREKHKATALRAFAFAILSCVLGLAFCLVKSPQAKSEAYLAAAVDALEHNRSEEAATAALETVRLNPAAVEGWYILSRMLQQNGDYAAAMQAKTIALKLQHSPEAAEPLYAMPAEFRLSLLALADTDVR